MSTRILFSSQFRTPSYFNTNSFRTPYSPLKPEVYSCPYLVPGLHPLRIRIASTPLLSSDKLHPSRAEAIPHARYADVGLWNTVVEFKTDTSPKVQAAKRLAENAEPFANLDALCENELARRYPGYQTVTGIRAWIRNHLGSLSEIFLRKRHPFEFTTQQITTLKRQIASSACNRADLISRPHIEDADLRRHLRVTDDRVLQTEHLFVKNSPMNGQSFLHKGRVIPLFQAIACSFDRQVANAGNLRVVQTASRRSIAYAGRPDSDQKSLEQATHIFFNELTSSGKGITQTRDAQGNTIYELDYVVNSMLSTPWIWGRELPVVAVHPEREFVMNEVAALKKLAECGTIEITDPSNPARTCKVKFNPMLFSRAVNTFVELEKFLPPFITGEAAAQEISSAGFETLETTVARRRAQLQDPQKIARVDHLMSLLRAHERRKTMAPEEELITRDLLCKILNLPMVYHCKSSTDRTSLAIAISTALEQWIALGHLLPDHPKELLDDWRFKELFVANWPAGHQITRYARGAYGNVNGERLDNKNLGLSLSRGIFQNPLVIRLLPERYLKPYPLWKRAALTTSLAVPILIASAILVIPTLFRHAAYILTLGHYPKRFGPLKFTAPLLPLTMLLRFPAALPSQMINEDSPLVGDRRLISGGNHHDVEEES